MAVAVVVQETTTCSPVFSRARYASLLGNVRESAVAVVVIEDVAAPISDEEIIVAIIVVVSDTAALAPSGGGQARLLGDVGKCTVAIVMKQVAGGILFPHGRVKTRSVHQENVEPAIVVVVE